ncbi:MAG: signal peptidase II [Chloroflexi bacterium]|nr:signal peptidase II [Chloroflexota bacterium]
MANNLKINWQHSLILFLTATAIFIADQISKALIRENMYLGESIPEEGRFRFAYSTNSGSAFGLSIDSTFLLVMAFVVIIVIIWLNFYYLSSAGKFMRVGLGLVLGGAMGNLIDRVRFGEVTDFLDVQLWGDFHWATFNIADASLTTGIFILMFCLLSMAKESH